MRFQHLTKGGDVVVSQDGHTFFCFCSSLSYSWISTSRGSGCILALCFASVFAPVFKLFLTLTTNFDIATMRLLPPLQCWKRLTYRSFVNRTSNCIPKWEGCLRTNCIAKAGRKLGAHPANREHTLQDC